MTGELLDGDLDIAADGTPARPLVTVDLDDCDTAEPAALAARVRQQLTISVGVLRGAPRPELAPLLDALALTVAQTPAPGLPRSAVPVPDVAAAVAELEAAVLRAPRAAIACDRLLRQTEVLDTTSGLAAEAAVYSMLLSGTEFARWLAERGPARANPLPDHALVRLHRDADRLHIALDHPERRNALSRHLREELLSALRLAEWDPGIATVELTGRGPAFCSGGDLDEFGTATDLVAAYLVRLDRAPWRVLDRIADRLTIRVHGACIGAGVEMAAFAGTIVAAPDAFFRFPEVHMGLVPGAGGTVSVPRRVGRHRAAWLMLTGARLDARAALDWGLVDRTAEPAPS